MPVSIILEADRDSQDRAIAAGFQVKTVLIRTEPVLTTKVERELITAKVLREIRPLQYLLSDYWGAGPD